VKTVPATSKIGRPRLPAAEKARRGTLRPHRERKKPPVTTTSRKRSKARVGVPSGPRDHVAIADRYVRDIAAGRIVACGWVQKAVERFERMRRRAADRACPFLFSVAEANAVCTFVERLPHVEGRWTTDTIRLEPWQIFILVACFGFRRRVDGKRLVTTVFFEVARKSAKSTLVAAVALYHLAVEREPGGQVVCAASTGQQARIVFGIMQRMVRRSLWLREQGLQVFANSIMVDATGAFAKPINSKSSTQDGLSPSFISVDESHAQTFELRDVLVSAMGARPDGAIWCPTTAGYSLVSVGYALRSTARKILDQVIESDHTFVILYELDEDDDWRDESVWIKAAPMIGITPALDYVQRYCTDAQQTPGMEAEFQTKVCNRWLHSASGWLSMAAWDRCGDTNLTLEDFRGEQAFIGADLAERDDIAAVAIGFRRGDLVYMFVKGYLPVLVVNERARAVPEYQAWVRSGELVTTDGNLTDFAVIEQDIRDLCDTFDVRAIVIERYGALNLAANLSNTGLPARIESKNPKVFTTPAKELEARIKAGKFCHNGSTFLKWHASNTCVERRRDGSLLPTKEGPESPNKIDAIDAVLLAMSAMLDEPAPVAPVEPAYQVFVFGGARR
jgi:phage terminase large subunit-like protein